MEIRIENLESNKISNRDSNSDRNRVLLCDAGASEFRYVYMVYILNENFSHLNYMAIRIVFSEFYLANTF